MAIQGIAQVPQARYFRGGAHQSPIMPPRTGSSLGSKLMKAAKGAGAAVPLASREIISPDVVGTSDEDMQDAVSTETQAPIEARGGRTIFTPGSLMDTLTSGGSARANTEYDPSKAIGGDNVPYKPATGIGGRFRRAFMGDSSNTDNIAAQQAQGQQWNADAREAKAQTQQLASEDRQFGRQKELFGMQADESAKRDASREGIQADKDASYETRWADKLAADQEKGINDDLQKMDLATLNTTSRENIASGNNASKEFVSGERNTSREGIAAGKNENVLDALALKNAGQLDLAEAVTFGKLTVAQANNIARSRDVDARVASSMAEKTLDSDTRLKGIGLKNDNGLAIQKLRNLGIQVKPGNMVNPDLFEGKSPSMYSSPNPFTHSAGGFGPVDSAEQMGGQLKGPGNSAAQRPGAKAAAQIQLERAQEGAQLEPTPEELAMWLKMKREKGGK